MILYDTSFGGRFMRKTIYLPDDLAADVDEYLKHHQGETLSSLVQEVLQERVAPRMRPSILDLAGFVSVDPDHVHAQEERARGVVAALRGHDPGGSARRAQHCHQDANGRTERRRAC